MKASYNTILNNCSEHWSYCITLDSQVMFAQQCLIDSMNNVWYPPRPMVVEESWALRKVIDFSEYYFSALIDLCPSISLSLCLCFSVTVISDSLSLLSLYLCLHAHLCACACVCLKHVSLAGSTGPWILELCHGNDVRNWNSDKEE